MKLLIIQINRNLAGDRRILITSYISLIIILLFLLGIIVSIHERKYFQNLLDNNSTQKFQKLKVDKLELKRYVKNTNLGSNISATPSKSPKKEVPLDSNSQDKMGIFNTIENELTVYAICKNTSHEVFTCPFSEENMKYLLQIVNDYNISN